MPTSAEWHARAEVWVPAIIVGHPEIVNIDTLWGITRDTEAYVPREYFREVAREYKETEVYLPIIDRMSEEDMIPRRWHQPTTRKYNTAYTYVVTVRGIDPEVGYGAERTMGIQSDTALTIGEIYEEADALVQMEDSPYYMLDYAFGFSAVLHRKGTEWA